MLVVSDSSPINVLVRVQCVHVLPTLFRRVLIPTAVVAELTRETSPAEVREFIRQPPPWLEVHEPRSVGGFPRLHAGESAAIHLAIEQRVEAVLIDDRDARRVATQAGLRVIGLLGILERADERGLLRLPEIATRLPRDYRIDPRLLVAAVDRCTRRGS